MLVIYNLHQACRQVETGSAPSSPAEGCTDCVLDQTHRQSTTSSMTAEPSRRTSRSLDPAALLSCSSPLPPSPPPLSSGSWISKVKFKTCFDLERRHWSLYSPSPGETLLVSLLTERLDRGMKHFQLISPPHDTSKLTGHHGYIPLLVKPSTHLCCVELSFVRQSRPGCRLQSASLPFCLRSVFKYIFF